MRISYQIRWWGSGLLKTHSAALIAIAGDLALASAKVNASVLVGVAPFVTLRLGHICDRNRAAGNGSVEGGVLRRGEAGKGRSRDDDGRVEHC